MTQLTAQGAPNIRSLSQRAGVNVKNLVGATWWPLYDYQTLATTAVSTQQFFAVPSGQSGKTETDTNMLLAGQIPTGQRFVMIGIGIDILPGIEPTQVAGTGVVNEFVNDIYAVLKTGRLKLTIGSKDYVNHGNLMKFPSLNKLDVSQAVATTVAATNLTSAYASADGAFFSTPQTEIRANQNFGVTLYDLPALPSGVAGRIGINLYGWLYRNAQ